MIRPATEADVPAILEIYAPYVRHSTATFEYDVPCTRDFMQRFFTITAQFPWLVWEEEGQLLGYAYASAPFERAAYRWCAEPTVYLRPEARGRDIALQLYTVLEAILQRQGYQVLYALVTSENANSLRFHRKMGYTVCTTLEHCGFKHGRWLGLSWMEKRLCVVKTPSAFPCSWLSIVQDAERFDIFLDSLSLS